MGADVCKHSLGENHIQKTCNIYQFRRWGLLEHRLNIKPVDVRSEYFSAPQRSTSLLLKHTKPHLLPKAWERAFGKCAFLTMTQGFKWRRETLASICCDCATEATPCGCSERRSDGGKESERGRRGREPKRLQHQLVTSANKIKLKKKKKLW